MSPEAPLRWQTGTVEAVATETYRVKTFTLRLERWRPFSAGQHFDARLTAPDGYQAQRSYSIASSPERQGAIDLTIELIPDGEVSPYFHQVLRPGDKLELRGPIGGPFTWRPSMGGPLLLVAAGSGIVPIMSILRHRSSAAPRTGALLLYSSRSPEDVIYSSSLEALQEKELEQDAAARLRVVHTFTRGIAAGWRGYRRRLDPQMIADVLADLGKPLHAYVCGPTPFVETAANAIVAAGIPPEHVHTERFGPSG